MLVQDLAVGTTFLWRDRLSKDVMAGVLTLGATPYPMHRAVMQLGSCIITYVPGETVCVPLTNRSEIILTMATPEGAAQQKAEFQSMLGSILR